MLNKIRRLFTYNVILFAMLYLNAIARVKSWFHSDKIQVFTPYQGQQILLIALYEKGKLRNDILRLLTLAKKKGLYIIGVNTLRLKHDDLLAKHFDCYIEKYNFGRDFSSYKTGFNYIFKHKLDQTCPRLLMLNDSVFYESTRCDAFIDTLITSDIEVLGATENFQFEHHLGSFCISFDQKILQHPSFKKFWRTYKNTDIRPAVIKNGEMGLSKLLRKIASTSDQVQSLYDVIHIANRLEADNNTLDNALQITCKPIRPTLGRSILANKILSDFVKKHYALGTGPSHAEDVLQECSFASMVAYLRNKLNINDAQLESKLSVFIKATIVNHCSMGSQIHKNAALFLYLGLPLIKLDLNFRGILSTHDIIALSNQLEPTEAKELQNILLKRIYYRQIFRRWDRTLADFGFL